MTNERVDIAHGAHGAHGGPSRTAVGGSLGRERLGVIGLAALIVLTIAIYLALRSSAFTGGGAGALLPYQTLVRDLVSADQTVFGEMQRKLGDIEAARAVTGRWPDGEAPSEAYTWTRVRQGLFLNYLATPSGDTSAPAWLLVVQEPDPAAPVDPAPNDETHHRLPDGTVLHVAIWTHRFGERMASEFVPQPQTAGWTQVLVAPVNPVANTATTPATAGRN